MFKRLLQAVRKSKKVSTEAPVAEPQVSDSTGTKVMLAPPTSVEPQAVTTEQQVAEPTLSEPTDVEDLGKYVLELATEVRVAARREANETERNLAQAVESPRPAAAADDEVPLIPRPRPKRLPYDRSSVTFD